MPIADASSDGDAGAPATESLSPDAATAAVPGTTALVDLEARFSSLTELARGGHGRVLVARDGVLRREVALKLPLHGGSGAALRRFEREALLTARLQHPGIVSVYELVRRPSGDPVLVMRRVQGRPFDRAIAEAGTYPKRLALLAPFVSACDAIAYAHRLGVIHRDIKPSNVLLGDFGDTVVIDWGLAKEVGAPEPSQEPIAGEAHAAADELLTGVGALVGTPGFMSPEQARGEPADARSDVYALGAMLYQLLAGQPPYPGKSSEEVLAALRSGPPAPVASLVPDLAAELSTIVARAMDPDRAKRFADAGELAEELKLFLTGRLVRSHSYSTWQLVRRWARRNAAVLAVSAVAAVLLLGAGVVGVRRILAERERANREANTARRVSGFMTGMFQVSDPSESRGNSITAREVLDKAARQIESNLAEDPEVRARLMFSMGTVYSNLGLYPDAVGLLDKAAGALRDVLGADHPDTLKARLQQALALRRNAKLKEAEPILLDLTERARRALGPGNPVTIDALNQLAVVLGREKRSDEAEALFREALENARKALGPGSPNATAIMNNLANLYSDTGRPGEARKLLEELLAIRKRTLGPEHPDTVTANYNLGYAYQQEGRLDDALAVYREVREQNRRIFGPDHPDTLDSSEAVSTVLNLQGRFAEAEPFEQEVVAGRRKRFGPEHSETLRADADLGNLLVNLGRLDEGERILKDTLAAQRRTLGEKSDDAGVTTFMLALLAARRGQEKQALLLVDDALRGPLAGQGVEAIESDLVPLRDDPRFDAVRKRLRSDKRFTAK